MFNEILFLAKHHKKKWQSCLEISSYTQLQACPSREKALKSNITLIIVCFFSFQTNLVFKFNLEPIKYFLSHFIYLLAFWYYLLKLVQCLLTLFTRTSKILMRISVVFESLEPQNVFSSIKYLYLLPAKITPDVSRS